MRHWAKALVTALLVPLVLAACLFVPGKFTSTLHIRADRSFDFTYQGEVNAIDIAGSMGKSLGELDTDDEDTKSNESDKDAKDAAADPLTTPTSPEERAKKDAEHRELATQLAKEAGYRSVEYRGNDQFFVDYAISGTLSHGFVFPYNQDASMLFPFVAVELRGKDGIRVKAPGFAAEDKTSELGGMGGGRDNADFAKVDGSFTLTTDAEIVSQNNEEGAVTAPAGKTITWKITPRTKVAPMAVLRVKAL